VLQVFDLKTKVRRDSSGSNGNGAGASGDSEVILGLNVVPDLTRLTHYTPKAVASSLERLAQFCILLAYYIDVRLPYEISLPQRGNPTLKISPVSGPGRGVVFASSSIRKLIHSKPEDLDTYARGLAMLALDMAAVGRAVGHDVATPADIVQLNRIVPAIVHGIHSATIRPVHDVDDLPDCAAVKAYIVDSYLDGSAEWNLVDRSEIESQPDSDSRQQIQHD
jgi:hypothetical protein